MTLQTFKSHKAHITNDALLSLPGNSDYFVIRQDGQWINRDEFVSIQMSRFGLRTKSLVDRALSTVGQ